MNREPSSLEERYINAEPDDLGINPQVAEEPRKERVSIPRYYWVAGFLFVIVFSATYWNAAYGGERKLNEDYGLLCRSEGDLRRFLRSWDGNNEIEVILSISANPDEPVCDQVIFLYDRAKYGDMANGPTGEWRIIMYEIWTLSTMNGAIQQHFERPRLLFSAVKALIG